jgi:hypothetical protein
VLADHFLRKFARENHRQIDGLERDGGARQADDSCLAGNVREAGERDGARGGVHRGEIPCSRTRCRSSATPETHGRRAAFLAPAWPRIGTNTRSCRRLEATQGVDHHVAAENLGTSASRHHSVSGLIKPIRRACYRTGAEQAVK